MIEQGLKHNLVALKPMVSLLFLMIFRNPSALSSISLRPENSQAYALLLSVCFKVLATEMLNIWWKFLGQVSYLALEI